MSTNRSGPANSGCRPPLWLILLSLVAVLAALVFGIQLIGVVAGLIFLPDVPLPDGANQNAHDNQAYGVDEWQYELPGDPCAAVTFFASEGADCIGQDDYCPDGVYDPPSYETEQIAECVHSGDHSIFGYRWRVSILPRYEPNPESTTVTAMREMLWGGAP